MSDTCLEKVLSQVSTVQVDSVLNCLYTLFFMKEMFILLKQHNSLK